MTRVIVTGATGFVGSHLVRALARDGAGEVRCLVRPGADVDALRGLGVGLVEGDVTVSASLRGALDDADVVYHCACAVRDTFDAGRGAASAFEAVNVAGTEAVAREAARAGVRRLVHVSSTAAMGVPDGARIDETSSCRPTTAYGRSKWAAERALGELGGELDLEVVIVRPCLIAGPGKKASELHRMCRLVQWGVFPCLGPGTQRKPLVHVDDVVQALRAAAARGQPGRVYLVTSGVGYPLRDIARTVGSLLGVRRSHVRVPLVPAALAAAWAERVATTLRVDPPITRARIELLAADRDIDIGLSRAELAYAPAVQALPALLCDVVTEYERGARD